MESAEPRRKIRIPHEVSGFEELRAELARHHPFSAQAKPPRAKLAWTNVVVWIVSILNWAAVIFIFYEVLRPRSEVAALGRYCLRGPCMYLRHNLL